MKYITVYYVDIPHKKSIVVVQTDRGYLKTTLADYKTTNLMNICRVVGNACQYDFTEYDHEKECYIPVAGHKKLASYTEETHPELFI